jgi:hypothetical protein
MAALQADRLQLVTKASQHVMGRSKAFTEHCNLGCVLSMAVTKCL